MALANSNKAGLIWKVAELLRGGWKQHEYQDVILPLVVLKRLDSILIDSKPKVLEEYNRFHGKIKGIDPILKSASGVGFYNTSPYDFQKLLEDPKHAAKNLRNYINGFSENIQEIFAKFDFERQLERLEGGDLLFQVLTQVNLVDLHPKAVSNHEMGQLFEELIRKFNEQSNETAGEHYTPREVIKVMVDLLFAPDLERLKKQHIIKTVYDCACGTGGMLTVSKEHVLETINPKAEIYLYGQELNGVTYAMCKADMLIKGEDPDKIKGGEKDHSKASTLSNDQFFGERFDYCLTNPPFGVDWKKDKEVVEREAERGHAGRFGAGLPRISDGQFLFLQHLISKMRRVEDGGSRLAIVMNGSPLFTGDAGSGESEIRRWILEHDWLETIVALPDQMFFNTGINTYLWFLSNRKDEKRKGKVQLIDARTFSGKMRKSLGNKRNEITDPDRAKIKKLYEAFEENKHSKIFDTTDFAYRQITVDRPLRLSFEFTDEKVSEVLQSLHVDTLRAVKRVKGTKKQNKELEQVLGSRAAEQTQDKNTEQLEIQQGIASALNSLRDKKWQNREKFIRDLEEAFSLQGGVRPAKKVLKTVVDIVGTRSETAEICTDSEGNPEPDSELRDYENVPWGQDIGEYFEREVKPYVADAWIDKTVVDHKDNLVGKVGYEMPFTRFFYTYQPPRDPKEIESEIKKVEDELLKLLSQI